MYVVCLHRVDIILYEERDRNEMVQKYENEIFTSCSRGDIMTTPPHGHITIASLPILTDHCNTQSPITLHTQHTDLKYENYRPAGKRG